MDVKNNGNLLQIYFQKIDFMIIRQICEKFREIDSAKSSDVNKLMGLQNVGGGMKKIEYELLGIMGGAKDEIYDLVEETAREYYGEAVKNQANPKLFESHNEILQIVEQTQQSLFDEFIKLMNIENIGFAGRDGGFRTMENACRASMSMALSAAKRGQSSYNEYVSSAVENLTEHGLAKMLMPQNFNKIRTRNAEASFQMDLRYQLVQMMYRMAEILAKENSATGYEISWHSGHRPTHTFGGKQFTFAQMKTMGVDDMLNDYNCRHWKFPVVVRVTPPKHSTEELERLEASELIKHEWDGKQYTLYELGQKKNEYNRKINKVSREIMALDALGKEYENELQKLGELLDKYEKVTDLAEGNEFYVVDRIEGNIAVVENKDGNSTVDIPLHKLPENVKEGDLLRFNPTKGSYRIDDEETERRNSELRERLWRLLGQKMPLPLEPATEPEREENPDNNSDSLNNFLESLGFRESSNNYDIVNKQGYMGKYQFGSIALRDIGFYDNNNNWTEKASEYGVYSKETFLNNPEAQEAAIRMLLKNNWRYLTNYGLLDYIGTTMNGVLITEFGLLAAAHLVGIGGLKKAIEAGDLTSVKDGNGVTAKEYMELFGGYNVDEIIK